MIKNVLSTVAQTISPGDIGLNNPATDPNVVIGNVLNTVYLWAGIIAVIVVIVAGIFYSISSGNPTQTNRAREAIIYAVVGLVFIMMAFVITQFVLGRFK